MSPDDRRHGSLAGYYAGCRLDGCRKAAARYEKQRRLDILSNKPPRLVPVIGTRRRIQALARIGWTITEQSRRIGLTSQALHYSISDDRTTVSRRRHEQVIALFELLSMTPGPSQVTAHRAAAKGWAPPLAWDDIDSPDERAKMPRDAGVILVRPVGPDTLETQRASHTAYRRGIRTPEIIAGERAYQQWSHGPKEDTEDEAVA